jgi:hypothetical protein
MEVSVVKIHYQSLNYLIIYNSEELPLLMKSSAFLHFIVC